MLGPEGLGQRDAAPRHRILALRGAGAMDADGDRKALAIQIRVNALDGEPPGSGRLHGALRDHAVAPVDRGHVTRRGRRGAAVGEGGENGIRDRRAGEHQRHAGGLQRGGRDDRRAAGDPVQAERAADRRHDIVAARARIGVRAGNLKRGRGRLERIRADRAGAERAPVAPVDLRGDIGRLRMRDRCRDSAPRRRAPPARRPARR